MNDAISRHGVSAWLDNIGYPKLANAVMDEKRFPSTQSLVLTCDGCRHVGTYDIDFPCSMCIRREKDYYEQE